MSESYSRYLKSDHWSDLKAKKLANSDKRCGICASTDKIDCHHLIYKNLIDVQTSDLRWLCRRCHFLAHELIDKGLIRFKSTNSNSRLIITKSAVKKHLGLGNKNMFCQTS